MLIIYDARGEQDQQLGARIDIVACRKQSPENGYALKNRDAGIASDTRVADQSAKTDRLAVLDDDLGLDPPLLEGGRIDIGTGGRHDVADLLLDIERDQSSRIDARRDGENDSCRLILDGIDDGGIGRNHRRGSLRD